MVSLFNKETIKKYVPYKYTHDKNNSFLYAEVVMLSTSILLILSLPLDKMLKIACLLPNIAFGIFELWLVIIHTENNKKKYLKRKLSEVVFFYQLLWIMSSFFILMVINWGNIENGFSQFCLYIFFFVALNAMSILLFFVIQNKCVVSPVLQSGKGWKINSISIAIAIIGARILTRSIGLFLYAAICIAMTILMAALIPDYFLCKAHITKDNSMTDDYYAVLCGITTSATPKKK